MKNLATNFINDGNKILFSQIISPQLSKQLLQKGFDVVMPRDDKVALSRYKNDGIRCFTNIAPRNVVKVEAASAADSAAKNTLE